MWPNLHPLAKRLVSLIMNFKREGAKGDFSAAKQRNEAEIGSGERRDFFFTETPHIYNYLNLLTSEAKK